MIGGWYKLFTSIENRFHIGYVILGTFGPVIYGGRATIRVGITRTRHISLDLPDTLIAIH